MKLLNTKSILEIENEEEQVTHVEEIQKIIDTVVSYQDYECALICKYQDVAHKDIEQEIRHVEFSQVLGEIEYFDFKNGIDLWNQGDYLILVLHGQGYFVKADNSYHLVTMAMKIMPYDENRSFVNVLPLLVGEKPLIAHGL